MPQKSSAMSTKVMVVDDSNFMRKSICDTLNNIEGVEVVDAVENGEIALDKALELMPDVITLDNILPDMHGLDILKALNEHAPSIKVIMISAVGQESVVQEALKNGASHYIVKPFGKDTLVEVFRKVESHEK